MKTPFVGSSINEGISCMSSSPNDFGAFKKILGPNNGSNLIKSNPIKSFHESIVSNLDLKVIIEL